jgi:hypothetical protein
MAAIFQWAEDNLTATGTPTHGTTRSGFGTDTHYPTDCNWKATDDCTTNSGTVYSASQIVAGSNSYTKYQYAHFSGTWNTISNGLFTHTAGTLGTGLTLVGTVTSTYVTPTTTSNAALTTNMTTALSISSGLAVLFSSTGPENASPTSSISGGGTAYSQYLATQLQTTASAAAGDTSSCILTVQYTEN